MKRRGWLMLEGRMSRPGPPIGMLRVGPLQIIWGPDAPTCGHFVVYLNLPGGRCLIIWRSGRGGEVRLHGSIQTRRRRTLWIITMDRLCRLLPGRHTRHWQAPLEFRLPAPASIDDQFRSLRCWIDQSILQASRMPWPKMDGRR
jgi:hypothetical protein